MGEGNGESYHLEISHQESSSKQSRQLDTMENMSKTRKKDKGLTTGLQVITIKEVLRMTYDMVMEKCIGMKEQCIKDNGLMVFKKEME